MFETDFRFYEKCRFDSRYRVNGITGRVINEHNRILGQRNGRPGIINLKTRRGPVWRVIYEHYIDKIPRNWMVYHKDGDKTNNCLLNLDAISFKEEALREKRNLAKASRR